MNEQLNPYVAYCGDPSEGAALVFAATSREAKRAAWGTLRGWFDAEYTDMRVRRLREHASYLLTLYDGRAVVESPPTCPVCGMWGSPLRGDGNGCEFCGGDDLPPNTRVNAS